jgi:CRP/FNR family cyclic AMP-dependent transcriptional regulator
MIGNPRTLPRRKPGVSGKSGEPPGQLPVAPENEDIVPLLVNEPHVALQSGQVLFTEGDPPSCMYVVKAGALRIRSGGVIYEDVGPGGIVGEMALVERYPARSATVYALSDCELVAVDEARFSSLVAEAPHFALRVMQILSRRLRAMDRRYRPEPLVAREPLEP